MFNLMCFENLNTLTNVGCVNLNIITSYTYHLSFLSKIPYQNWITCVYVTPYVKIILTLLVVYIETPTNPITLCPNFLVISLMQLSQQIHNRIKCHQRPLMEGPTPPLLAIVPFTLLFPLIKMLLGITVVVTTFGVIMPLVMET